ncbi:uncharacterized protein LOC107645967 isoform X2 [Arachis ipaensis]|uniref:uncharacterized protein LOC107645967 isoform X2 n=1 Tax=Arachis ipaensis TaxID=130454 RepID=UPI000A2B46DD|nr:uncharacterized protein LOC107645967 isoform X2 [Arachis ipaensis]XP_025662779.1 uncharacterized protein LOC112758345 isoform X2 [Arachis hypogaea]
MGSEGPPSAKITTIHVTGFKKFHGVSDNPTETIVNNLTEYMNKKTLPKCLTIGSCTILETAGEGALVPLYQTLQSALIVPQDSQSESSNSNRIIWLHFGVNSGATRFAIEKQAFNEANFRCPDEMGWKPQFICCRESQLFLQMVKFHKPVRLRFLLWRSPRHWHRRNMMLWYRMMQAGLYAITFTTIPFVLQSRRGLNLFLFMCHSSQQ